MTKYPPLKIPDTLAAGPGPGNTDPRVLQRLCETGVADHMQADVLRGMVECKQMLRRVFGTENTYTFGVGGTGFSGLDCVLSAILPGDHRDATLILIMYQHGLSVSEAPVLRWTDVEFKSGVISVRRAGRATMAYIP